MCGLSLRSMYSFDFTSYQKEWGHNFAGYILIYYFHVTQQYFKYSNKVIAQTFAPKLKFPHYPKAFVTTDLGDTSGCQVYKQCKRWLWAMHVWHNQTDNSLGCAPLWLTDTPSTCSPLNISEEARSTVVSPLLGIVTKTVFISANAKDLVHQLKI